MLSWHSHTYSGAGAHGELSGGGAEDLQTDVMRFMAMLALCLVAIFALVQSLPMRLESSSPTTTPVASPDPSPDPSLEEKSTVSVVKPVAVVEAKREPVASPPDAAGAIDDVKPEGLSLVPLEPLPKPSKQPSPPPLRVEQVVTPPQASAVPAAAPTSVPVPEDTPVAPVEGDPTPKKTPEFTLRFGSDAALLTLVQGGRVALYAVDGRGTSRLDAAAPRLRFRSTAAPSAMHDMDPTSVPNLIRTAYLRSRGASDTAVRRWGVVLPSDTLRAIDELLTDPIGGELRIAADGGVTLEPAAP